MTATENAAVRNGVDTDALFATIGAVRATPQLARFTFRATNQWISGTHNRGTTNGYYGAGEEHLRPHDFTFDADHPPVLCGADEGPAPIEYVLQALAACLTSGLANIAAARGVTLTAVTSTIEGDINLLGILGLDDPVRNGFDQIRLVFTIDSDAPPEKLRELVERSRQRSAVYDVITNAVPVDIVVRTW
jgi:uncharacterized OsmC-like protein